MSASAHAGSEARLPPPPAPPVGYRSMAASPREVLLPLTVSNRCGQAFRWRSADVWEPIPHASVKPEVKRELGCGADGDADAAAAATSSSSSSSSSSWRRLTEWSICLEDRVVLLRQDVQRGYLYYRTLLAGDQGSVTHHGAVVARPQVEGTLATDGATAPSSCAPPPPSPPPLARTHPDEVEEATRAWLSDYLQLDVSVEALYEGWRQRDRVFARYAGRFRGVRMLRQDPWECLCAFICSSNNNIARIGQMVQSLATQFSPPMLTLHYPPPPPGALPAAVADGGDVKQDNDDDDDGDDDGGQEVKHVVATSSRSLTYHAFPSARALADGATEERLRRMGFGYRAKYVAATAQRLCREHVGGGGAASTSAAAEGGKADEVGTGPTKAETARDSAMGSGPGGGDEDRERPGSGGVEPAGEAPSDQARAGKRKRGEPRRPSAGGGRGGGGTETGDGCVAAADEEATSVARRRWTRGSGAEGGAGGVDKSTGALATAAAAGSEAEAGSGACAATTTREAGARTPDDETPSSFLHSLRRRTYDEAKAELVRFDGVGPKVADCILLMSMDQPEAIPVDRHVFQFAERWYGLRVKVTNKGYDELSRRFRELWGAYAGWAHTVLFTADLRAFSGYGKDEEAGEGATGVGKAERGEGGGAGGAGWKKGEQEESGGGATAAKREAEDVISGTNGITVKLEEGVEAERGATVASPTSSSSTTFRVAANIGTNGETGRRRGEGATNGATRAKESGTTRSTAATKAGSRTETRAKADHDDDGDDDGDDEARAEGRRAFLRARFHATKRGAVAPRGGGKARSFGTNPATRDAVRSGAVGVIGGPVTAAAAAAWEDGEGDGGVEEDMRGCLADRIKAASRRRRAGAWDGGARGMSTS